MEKEEEKKHQCKEERRIKWIRKYNNEVPKYPSLNNKSV